MYIYVITHTCTCWRHERSSTHRPMQFSRLGIWCPVLLCVVFVTLICVFGYFVWGGVSETSFLLFLHLFLAGVLCTCVSVYITVLILMCITGTLHFWLHLYTCTTSSACMDLPVIWLQYTTTHDQRNHPIPGL